MNEILYSRHFGGDVQGFALYGAKLLFPLFLCVWRNLIKCTNVCVCHTLYVHLCVREGYYRYCRTTAQFSCFVGYLKRLSLQPFIYLPRKCVCNLRVWIHGQGLGLAPKRIADILDTNWQSNSCIIIIRVSLFVTLMLDDYWSVCVCVRAHTGVCVSFSTAGGEKRSELWEMSGNLVKMECQGYRGYRGILPVAPSTLQWFTASWCNIWSSAVWRKHVEREWGKVKMTA